MAEVEVPVEVQNNEPDYKRIHSYSLVRHSGKQALQLRGHQFSCLVLPLKGDTGSGYSHVAYYYTIYA